MPWNAALACEDIAGNIAELPPMGWWIPVGGVADKTS